MNSNRQLSDSFGWQLISEQVQSPISSQQQRLGNSRASQMIKQLNHRCFVLESEKQQLMLKLFEKEESVVVLQNHLQAQANQLRLKHNSQLKTSDGFRAEVASLNKQVSELLDIIKTNKDEIAMVNRKVGEVTQANNLLKRNMEKIEKELDGYKSENAELAEEIKQIKFNNKRDDSMLVERGYSTTRYHMNALKSHQQTYKRIPLRKCSNNPQPSPGKSQEDNLRLTEKQRKSILDRLKTYRKTIPKEEDFEQLVRTLRQFK